MSETPSPQEAASSPRGAPDERGRRRHRRRRRSGRLGDRGLPRDGTASTSCSWRRPRSPATRSAATASPPARSASSLTSACPPTGWARNKGLRIVGGGHRFAPRLAGERRTSRRTGMVRTPRGARRDPRPVRRKQGRPPARGHERHRPGPRRARPAAITGVTGQRSCDAPTTGATARRYTAPGRRRGRRRLLAGSRPRWAGRSATDRPMGVAVRTYYASRPARTTTTWSPGSSCGCRRTPADPGARVAPTRRRRRSCCPATAGCSAAATARANVGLGMLDTSPAFGDGRLQATSCVAGSRRCPAEWTLHARDDDRRRSAAPRCRWRSTGSPCTPTASCSSATPAAWSTRSTARASTTRCEAGRLAAEIIAQALRPRRRGRPRAGARVVRHGHQGRPRRLLHAGARGSPALIGQPEVMRLAREVRAAAARR